MKIDDRIILLTRKEIVTSDIRVILVLMKVFVVPLMCSKRLFSLLRSFGILLWLGCR